MMMGEEGRCRSYKDIYMLGGGQESGVMPEAEIYKTGDESC